MLLPSLTIITVMSLIKMSSVVIITKSIFLPDNILLLFDSKA